MAKLCKIKVNEFAIGFGPTILKKQGKETKYALRLIPLGGFVSLEGEDERSKEEGSFSEASIPKRMAIIVAGGLVNIIFGIVVYFVLMSSLGNNTSLVVDDVISGYAAEGAGIIANDEIIKVNDKKIHVKSDINEILQNSNGQELKITILRDGKSQEISLVPTRVEYKNTGIYLKSTDEESTKIVTLAKSSPAEEQGLKANDEIIKINGVEVKNQAEIIQNINEIETDKITFTVKRHNETIDVTVTPNTIYSYYIGVQFKPAENTFLNNIYYAAFETRDFIFSIVDNLKMLFTGNVGIDQMMGPVGISEAVANTKQVEDFVYLMALISLSLGVTNLLPFPALDGGKFVLLLLEAIRGKKLKEKTEINLTLLGFAILIALSIYITYNDILRIF